MLKPEALLEFAEQHKTSEGASRRAAISRAYYAAFHSLQPGVDPMVDEADCGKHGCAHHGIVLKCLKRWAELHPDRSSAMRHGADALKCYHLMVALLEAREMCDYDLSSNGDLDPREAVNLVGKAHRVMKYAQSFVR